jgi:putative Holliday junction resolvase
VSDPGGTLATPIEPVPRPGSRRGLAMLAEVAARWEVARVVVGLPRSLSGDDSEQTRETRRFAERLAERLGPGVAVELYDERFTTRLAGRDPAPRASEDSRAAAHLLQDWLSARGRRAS